MGSAGCYVCEVEDKCGSSFCPGGCNNNALIFQKDLSQLVTTCSDALRYVDGMK